MDLHKSCHIFCLIISVFMATQSLSADLKVDRNFQSVWKKFISCEEAKVFFEQNFANKSLTISSCDSNSCPYEARFLIHQAPEGVGFAEAFTLLMMNQIASMRKIGHLLYLLVDVTHSRYWMEKIEAEQIAIDPDRLSWSEAKFTAYDQWRSAKLHGDIVEKCIDEGVWQEEALLGLEQVATMSFENFWSLMSGTVYAQTWSESENIRKW